MKIIKFEQPGCSPCISVSNFLDDAGIEYEAIDVTEKPEIASQFGIMATPVVMVFDDNGNKIKEIIGYNVNKLKELVEMIKNN